jgi:hypothetical protein
MCRKLQIIIMRWIVLLLLFVSASVFAVHETGHDPAEPAAEVAGCLKATARLKPCHYAWELDKSIFSAAFVCYLRKQLQDCTDARDTGFSKADMRAAVDAWNAGVAHARRLVEYTDVHFRRMANLWESMQGESASAWRVDSRDLQVLAYWMDKRGELEVSDDHYKPLTDADLDTLNVDGDPLFASALQEIVQVPFAERLLRNLIDKGVTIDVTEFQGITGCYDHEAKLLCIDRSTLRNPLRYHCLLHELVHVINPGRDNSIIEETLAESIAMALEDEITGIPVACHTYYVFIDRLFRDGYRDLPMDNDFGKWMDALGIELQ